MAQENALITIEQINPAVVFTAEGIETLIKQVEKIAREHVPDVSTSAGRQEIKSLAYKVARSKTLIDETGKDHFKPKKDEIKIGDGARKAARDRLDALKIEVRAPLTEWEDVEAERIAEAERVDQARIDGIMASIDLLFGIHVAESVRGDNSSVIANLIAKVGSSKIGDEYQEFHDNAIIAKKDVLCCLEVIHELAVAKEKEAAELKAEKERLAKEREEIAEERRIQAEEKKKAEEKAEVDRLALKAQQDEFKAQQDKAAEEQAERDRIENERQEKIKAEDAERQAAERAEAMRPDREKLIAFTQLLRKNSMVEAGKIDLESDAAQRLMSGLLENIDDVCAEVLDSRERL